MAVRSKPGRPAYWRTRVRLQRPSTLRESALTWRFRRGCDTRNPSSHASPTPLPDAMAGVHANGAQSAAAARAPNIHAGPTKGVSALSKLRRAMAGGLLRTEHDARRTLRVDAHTCAWTQLVVEYHRPSYGRVPSATPIVSFVFSSIQHRSSRCSDPAPCARCGPRPATAKSTCSTASPPASS